mmetsp:Transcript_107250/g.303211  ORF Transcript_107250/g.303211 Transcript_107250/m.303211 type:complete len:245 (-) Transcript_107250:333-1067(-)
MCPLVVDYRDVLDNEGGHAVRLREAAGVRGDHGDAAELRLHGHDPEGVLAHRRHDEHPCQAQDLVDVFRRCLHLHVRVLLKELLVPWLGPSNRLDCKELRLRHGRRELPENAEALFGTRTDEGHVRVLVLPWAERCWNGVEVVVIGGITALGPAPALAPLLDELLQVLRSAEHVELFTQGRMLLELLARLLLAPWTERQVVVVGQRQAPLDLELCREIQEEPSCLRGDGYVPDRRRESRTELVP